MIEDLLASIHDDVSRTPPGAGVGASPPALGRVSPDRSRPHHFGVAAATADGQVFEVGHTMVLFPLESIAAPFVYGTALERRGQAAVSARIGDREAPGALDPLRDAGTLAATALCGSGSRETRHRRLLGAFGAYTGHPVGVDPATYERERALGREPREIARRLRGRSIMTCDPEIVTDLYFRQRSLFVTCRDLAVMGATLAAGGVNPLSGERALAPEHADSVLGVMSHSGMGDDSGWWTMEVGLPARSGLAGSVIAVLPGKLAVAVYSPPIDARGHSLRGVEVCRALARRLGRLDAPGHLRPAPVVAQA